MLFLLDMHCFKKGKLFDLWLQKGNKEEKQSAIFLHITKLVREEGNILGNNIIKEKIFHFHRICESKWHEAHRHFDILNKNHAKWLMEDFIIETDELIPSTSSGRPVIPFSAKSVRSKRREA